MRVTATAAAWGALRKADLDLSPGRYVVLSTERAPLEDLVALLCGRHPPRTGSLTLDGGPPYAIAPLRARIACLLQDEALPPARTVQGAVAQVLAARGEDEQRGTVVLEGAGLSRLAALAPAAISARETRSIALALALAHPTAELLVLHEPLTTLIPSASVLQELDFHTSRGAVVLCTTTSPADAAQLGGRWLSVELGRIDSRELLPVRLGQGQWQQVLVEANDASALLRLLQENAPHLSCEPGTSPGELKVMGMALDVTVRELLGLARQHGLELLRIEPSVPPVEALMAARAGYARGAYEAARAAALGKPPSSAFGRESGGSS